MEVYDEVDFDHLLDELLDEDYTTGDDFSSEDSPRDRNDESPTYRLS